MKELELYKGIVNDFKNNRPYLDKNVIKNMVSNYLKYHSLPNSAVKRININNYYKNGYDTNQILFIDPYMDYSNEITEAYDDNHEIDDGSSLNKIITLCTIFHELTHIEQKYLRPFLFNSQFVDDQVADSIDKVANIDYDEYLDIHDFLLFEYYANIRSFMEFEDIYLKYLKEYIDNKTMSIYNRYLAGEIVFVYNENKNFPLLNNALVTSDISDYFIDNVNILLDGNPSDLTRLKMGLPINDTTFDYIDDIAKAKCKTLNLFEDIKKISN